VSTRGKFLFPAAILLFSFFCSGIALASGQKESQLSTAQQLIKEKKYNDAIIVLTEVMKNNPQEFDRAQALLEQIYKARQTYNDKVAELVKVFNEGNLEKAYEIIKELESLDRAPNERTLEAQAYARATATYVYDTKQFEKIMDEALPELKAGNYPQAVNTYLSGFDIGLDLFKQASYGNIVVNKVMNLRSDITSTSKDYLARLKELEVQQQTVKTDLSKPEQLGPDLESMITTLHTINQLKKHIADDSTNLKIQRESLVIQGSNRQDVPLIGYLDRFVHGRENSNSPEGILAAIDQSWNASLESVYTALDGQAKAHFADATRSLDGQQWQQASGQFEEAKVYALLANRAAAAWGMQVTLGDSLAISDSSWAIIRKGLAAALDAEITARVVDGYASLIAQEKTGDQIALAVNSTSLTMEALNTQRKQVLQVASILRGMKSTWSAVKEHYASLTSQKLDLASGVSRIDALLSAVDDALSGTDSTTVAIVSREDSTRLSPIQGQVDEVKSQLAKAKELMVGLPPADASGAVAAELKQKYPGQAVEILTAAKNNLAEYYKIVQSATSDLSNAGSSVLNATSIQRIISEKNRLSSEISQVASQVESSLSDAKQQLFQAERYRQEGENKLRLAQNDLANRRFASARQQIASAADSLDKSLSYQENADVRTIRDQQIPRISSQITDDENTVVVRDVRTYINEGRQLYSQGNYARAQDLFLRAESRWNTTNTQPNPEITTWLKYVNTALSINSGRVVAPTDPLYPEVTQVLNLAQDDYDRAKKLVDTGKNAQAQSLLTEAQTKLIYVQIPFPLNKEARVLSLKLLQLTDPKNFAATFKQKYDQALSELQSNPQDAYIALKDLEAIEPNYQGLQQALYRVEVLIGMRRPPPDTAKVTESNDLYQKAFDIVRQNVRAQYPIALSYLNKAIELNPNNQQAAALKDRIAIDQGAETTVVLSSTDQVQFKLAQEQFIAKSYYEALRIVNQLLKDPANQNYSPLLDLKRRIESKI